MRMKQMHRRILEGCLACLLCFTGSIPAFAAQTATPANADERREILPDLESEAPGTLESKTPEASKRIGHALGAVEFSHIRFGQLLVNRHFVSFIHSFL